MNLYLIGRPKSDIADYDNTYWSAVVAAPNNFAARNIHPSGNQKDGSGNWCCFPDEVTAKLIGMASPRIKQGVICASFNAS